MHYVKYKLAHALAKSRAAAIFVSNILHIRVTNSQEIALYVAGVGIAPLEFRNKDRLKHACGCSAEPPLAR